MRFPRTQADALPFRSEGQGIVDVGRLVGGERLGQLVDADVKNRFRTRVERWAIERWANEVRRPVVDSMVTIETDGVTARVPLYEITEETAVVRGVAAQPVKMSLTIEPSSWTQRLFSRLAGGAVDTGDAGFDRAWRVVSSDARAARQLLDEETREALRDVGCWCRATYADGTIEVRLDDDNLAGTHVLGGIEIALLLARARVHTNAYR